MYMRVYAHVWACTCAQWVIKELLISSLNSSQIAHTFTPLVVFNGLDQANKIEDPNSTYLIGLNFLKLN